MSRNKPKTIRYIHAVHWIADNPETEIENTELQDQPTVRLLADTSGRNPLRVAVDVLEYRESRPLRKKKKGARA